MRSRREIAAAGIDNPEQTGIASARKVWAKPFYAVGALAVAFVLAALAIRFVPFGAPLPIYLDVAKGLVAAKGLVTGYPPFGYSLFLVGAMRLAGLHGIFYGQALVYVVVVLLAYLLIAGATPAREFAGLGAIAVALHPQLLLNIKRISDHNLDVPGLLAVTLLMPKTLRARPILPAIGSGLVFGYMCEVRPNFDLLAIAFALFLLWRRQFAKCAALISVAALTLVALSLSATGALQFPLPGYGGYGAYTLACGNNPTSLKSLIRDEDCETMEFSDFIMAKLNIPRALQAGPQVDEWRQRHAQNFYRLAFTFIRQHPAMLPELIAVKMFTLFRPDFRRIETGSLMQGWSMAIMEVFLALPFPLWIITRLAVHKTIGWTGGLPTLPIAVIYVIPFLLTNADPRFRLPLDILMITDIFACLPVAIGRVSTIPSFSGMASA